MLLAPLPLPLPLKAREEESEAVSITQYKVHTVCTHSTPVQYVRSCPWQTSRGRAACEAASPSGPARSIWTVLSATERATETHTHKSRVRMCWQNFKLQQEPSSGSTSVTSSVQNTELLIKWRRDGASTPALEPTTANE